MPISANIGSVSSRSKQIVDGSHSPIIRDLPLEPSQGELESGLLLSRNASGNLIPYGKPEQVIGTGDGSSTAFSVTLTSTPLLPGSVEIDDGAQKITDDGYGSLGGDGTGTVNYQTGEVSLTMNAAPANGVEVKATYATRLVGVLLRTIDTAVNTTALVVVHGTVSKNGLVLSGGDLSQAEIDRLAALTIYAR